MSFRESLTALSPTPAAYLKAARELVASKEEGFRETRCAVLSTFTAQVIEPYLVVESARRGMKLTAWFAPWGQLEEQVLDGAGELYAQKPDVIVVLARLEELAPELLRGLAMPREETDRLALQVTARLKNLFESIRRNSKATVLLANFIPPFDAPAGLVDAMLPDSRVGLVQQVNGDLAQACTVVPGVFLFDLARVAVRHGLQAWGDAKLFHMARIPVSVSGQIALARGLARTMRAALIPPAKVLVLDLDNTLWGGVLGEDGVGGIALGDEYPGNVYKAFQRYLKTLKDRGFLLAVATKNNPADVEELWARHQDCPLRREDFATVHINWQEKSTNLYEIAAELNVGRDSLVFFDDSAFERAEVRKNAPEVIVIDAPDSALGYIDAIEESGYFDRLTLSAEDRQRSALYQEQATRVQWEQGASSPEEFLQSLELVATIGPVDAETLPRVAQLLAKTNQFNLTVRRHTAAEISALIEQGSIATWLRLADRFGDNGLVGVAIAVPENGARWRVDSFLLSCRVIGRRAETALLADLARRIGIRGGRVLAGEFCPAPKNSLVADFYPRHGFGPSTEHRWERDIAEQPLAAPECIRITSYE